MNLRTPVDGRHGMAPREAIAQEEVTAGSPDVNERSPARIIRSEKCSGYEAWASGAVIPPRDLGRDGQEEIV